MTHYRHTGSWRGPKKITTTEPKTFYRITTINNWGVADTISTYDPVAARVAYDEKCLTNTLTTVLIQIQGNEPTTLDHTYRVLKDPERT
jgi:hypothetical protein